MCNSGQRGEGAQTLCCTKLSPKDGAAMDLDSFLVLLYVLVDDWWKLECSSEPPKTGRPALLSDSEVMTLAILAQWPRFRSERDFWRFAWAHLCPYFPMLCSQGQLNRRVRALEPELRAFQRAFAETLSVVFRRSTM